MPPTYPEILALEKLIQRHQIQVTKLSQPDLVPGRAYFPVELVIRRHRFTLYLEDEYRDWHEPNQPMCLCLALRELESYAEGDDYLHWCQLKGLTGNERLRQYHMDLRTIYAEIEHLLGEVDAQISDWDFGLNAGAAQALRLRNQQ
jgi:hypothetical protein